MAMHAPAPAQMPSIAAMTGCGQARIALTRSPVMRVKRSSSGISILTSGPMMSCTSPPEQKLPPLPVDDDGADVVDIDEVAEQVAQLGIALEGQWVLALRAG